MELIYRGVNYQRPLGRENSDVEIDIKCRGVAYRLSPTSRTFQKSLVSYKYRGVDYTKRYC